MKTNVHVSAGSGTRHTGWTHPLHAVLAVGALTFAVVLGCGGGVTTTPTTTTGTGGATTGNGGSTGSTTISNTGGITGTGGGGADGGTPSNGPPATAFVGAGQRSTSPGFVMIYTLGQSTQNQDRSTSKSYVMQGGLIGANGSVP